VRLVKSWYRDLNQSQHNLTRPVPAIAHSGQYDLQVEIIKNGVAESATLYGAILVDNLINITNVEPRWGPVNGGFRVKVTGEGFEPGNTVMNGVKVRIGNMPSAQVKVLSTTLLEVLVPRGTPGLHLVEATNRHGDTSKLAKEEGVGYGLKLLSSVRPSLVFPTDVVVDQESGVAITSGGYFKDGYSIQMFNNLPLPESTRAASFDIQDPYNPLLVGGESALPSGAEAHRQLGEYTTWLLLKAKQTAASDGSGPPLTYEEKETMDNLSPGEVQFSLDSLRIQTFMEKEGDFAHKRLLVASGNGGVARLNLDEQNGLKYMNSVFSGSGQSPCRQLYAAFRSNRS